MKSPEQYRPLPRYILKTIIIFTHCYPKQKYPSPRGNQHDQNLNRNWYELSVSKQLFGGKIRRTLEPLAIPNEVLRAHLDALHARSLSLFS